MSPSDRKLIAVIGATGHQGGGCCVPCKPAANSGHVL